MNGKDKKMNSELQKKWFVYLSDHHEGPFNAVELSQKQKSGIVTTQSYVWAEGMTDWKPLLEVNELIHDLKKLESPNVVSPANEKNSSRHLKLSNHKSTLALKIVVIFFGFIFLGVLTLAILSRSGSERIHLMIRPTLNKIIDRAPILSSIFYLIPNTNELKADARKEMEEALLGTPAQSVKIAIALSQNNPNRPSLIVATNLPDRTKFEVYLIGNSDTLLNRLHYQTQFTVNTMRGLGRSEVLLSEDGQPLSKGEYQIWVTEAQEQDDSLKDILSSFPVNRPAGVLPAPLPNSAKFVLNKTVFIGGARDEQYLTRLKAFHEKIKLNSEKELVELRQYADTLTLQFQSLTNEFEKVLKRKQPTAEQLGNWKKSSKQWLEINGQMEQTIQTWSKETLTNEFFYGTAYELVKSAYDSIKNLFTIENNYMEKPEGHTTFQIQHGKAVSECKQTLDQLKGKIELILKAPKSPNGLPKREGL
jgi:hypothetical protein